ncbi:DUF4376 domain-containing protein [Pseudomonas putida]|uniref:DUF4376 domain-containing protein n=1 Tax=Pseudomonas putida TaxID=303 RepID=UPI002022E530|nr:DUF4376 domain-containing protein [Pseudomonas putida]MCL8309008.1 DUF4376 domain-containing protein [Pseudomonas putida]
MWALIIGGTVRELTDVDPIGRFHPAMSWVPCGESVAEGDLYEDGIFSRSPNDGDIQPTAEAVDAERDRRIDAGVRFQDVLYQSRATDRENISGAAQLGFMAVVAGAQPGDFRWSDPDEDFQWIAADNSLVSMDAQTVVAFGKAAAERKQGLIFAGRQLKDMNPIPADFTDDKWWP